ncbi:MAG: bifunctional phosphoglucose/phosphomannose isomerase [Nanoarchaeota archaeon]|nr:bifunctional phosphoglucose/phosphomannose isomerase [Nanoarchaeota archaeon]MBU1029808.1 bifunctional phosphoglucose/phosphomannose isomerase [Nanoarchaeota archaeon]MBU1850053.1 bifunctional phosphoglucose/phosphomannose isomerase [Nanoarchaeota archaeon]
MSEEKEESIFPKDFYQYDTDDMKGAIKDFPKQIKEAYSLGKDVDFQGEINRIVVAGMGGSAIAGDILKSYLSFEKINVDVSRSYDLPIHVDEKTLVFISSYSGNTEETISAYRAALRNDCKIVAITSGGKVKEFAEKNRHKLILIPSGIQPRAALAYSFFPIVKVLENLRIVSNKQADVERLIKAVSKDIYEETGIKLSEKLVDKTPIIYSSELFAPVAYRWKTQLNENAKTMAFYHLFSELNHNELEGYKNRKGDFHVINLKVDVDNRRILKRMDVTKEILRREGVDVTDIAVKGDTFLTKLFSAIYMGDWTSYYLALRYKTNPSSVSVIEDFKKKLGQSGSFL